MSSENSVVYQFVKKLGFIDNKAIIEKTNELLRRLETKSIGHLTKSSDNAKAVLCIDLASDMLGLEMDSKVLLRLSGFSKSEFIRTKRTFEKILDISQNFDIPKICIQLGISHVQKSAQQLYNDYTRYASHLNNSELDFTHPQYFTMAVYQACKKDKVKVLKSNLIKLSHLKAQQWEKLDQSWSSVMDKSKAIKLPKQSQEISEVILESNKPNQTHTNNKEPRQNYFNSYNSWKTELLKKSYKNLIDSKSIEHIDIYIIGFVLELEPRDFEMATKLLESYYNCIQTSVNPIDPKYSAMAVYKFLLRENIEIEETEKHFLMEYSKLTYLQWTEFENEWNERMLKADDVQGIKLSMEYDEFDKWIVDFGRI